MMIFGPLMYTVTLVLHRIRTYIRLDDLLLLLSIIIFSMSSMFWTSLVSIEYFISLSTSGLVYLLVFIFVVLVQSMFHGEHMKQEVSTQ
mgnify:FL=1